jgi:hypothetical protein
MLGLAAGCSQAPAHVLIDPRKVELTTAGATRQAAARVVDEYGDDVSGAAVTWSSGDPAVATVDNLGLITAVGSGHTSVSATLGELANVVDVKVDIFATGSLVAPDFLKIGEEVPLTFDLEDDKGGVYEAESPACRSDDPAVIDVRAGKLVGVAAGHAKIVCTLGTATFDATVPVLPVGLAVFARTEKDVTTDYVSIRAAIDGLDQVTAVGTDHVKLVRFQLRGSGQPYAYEFCGTREKLEVKLADSSGNPMKTAFVGACAASFPTDAPPWKGAPWRTLLVEADQQGIVPAADEVIEVTAAKPNTWVMKGGGKTHLTQGG